MSKFFYMRLAVNNIRKNGRTYIPYILTCIMTVMMFYIMLSLSGNPGIESMRGSAVLASILKMGVFIVGFFSIIFLFYTNSFLMKRRKKEFGLFNILGLEKKHLAVVVALETLIVAIIGIGLGIAFGIVLDKLLFLSIAHIMNAEITLGFYVSWEVIQSTIILFGIIFALIFLKSVNTIRVSKPIELLRGGNVGEKEPKTKWVMALLGIVTLAAGYYLASTVENAVIAINVFFIAVILVIIGTYLVFTAGSIAILKLLKKNKRYYYKTKHFISVSGMIYRMKQNAVGLANICILSTFVLVMVATTTSLMIGMEDTLHNRYPNDFGLYFRSAQEDEINESISKINEICRDKNLEIKNEIKYSYIGITALEDGDKFIFDMSESFYAELVSRIRNLVFTTVEDYNTITGENISLNAGEVMLYANRDPYKNDHIKIFDKDYKIVRTLDKFHENGTIASDIVSSYYIVVSGMDEIKDLEADAIRASGGQEGDLSGTKTEAVRYYYGFDSDKSVGEQLKVYELIRQELNGVNGYIELKEENRHDFMAIYGGLFFLGIFLSVLFVMATVLIIYYKQISEGYEDKERFNIMQKVGMSQSEVKSAINSQVLTVFFIPLVVAGIHLAGAFPMLSKLLSALNMNNVSLYLTCSAAAFAVFAVIYVIIYSMTARVYYKIVRIK